MAARPAGQLGRVAYAPAGLAAPTERLRALAPRRVVVEATGGLETPLLASLRAAGLPAGRVPPQQGRAFARALGRRAKTDALDARLLAEYGERAQPEPRPRPEAAAEELQALVTRRSLRSGVDWPQASARAFRRRGSAPAAPAPRCPSRQRRRDDVSSLASLAADLLLDLTIRVDSPSARESRGRA